MFSKVAIVMFVVASVVSAGSPFRLYGVKGGMQFQQQAARPMQAATKGGFSSSVQAPEPAFYEQPAQHMASATKGSFVAPAVAVAAPAAPLQQATLTQSAMAEPVLTQSVSYSAPVKGAFSPSLPMQQAAAAPVQSTVEETFVSPSKGSLPASAGYTHQIAQAPAAVVAEAPAAQEPQAFAAKGSGSYVQSSAPIYQSSAPVVQSSAPIYQSSAPVVQSAAPVYQSAAPVYQSSAPIAQSSAPVVEAAPSVQLVDSAPIHVSAPAKGFAAAEPSLAQAALPAAGEQKSA